MAAEAAKRYPGRGLDLAILPETTVTSTAAPPRRGRSRSGARCGRRFGALARKHKTLHRCSRWTSPRKGRRARSTPTPPCSSTARARSRASTARPIRSPCRQRRAGGRDHPGREFPVFDCDFGKLGIQICWDIQFDDGWDALAERGAELVAWPTASPATAQPAARAAPHRYYVVSSTWRDDATVFEPTGLVAAQVEPPGKVLVHQLDLSYAVLGWSPLLKNGKALREKYGDRVGYHYEPREDLGLFWSNDPKTTIGEMMRSIGGEEIDAQVARNRRIQDAARGDLMLP